MYEKKEIERLSKKFINTSNDDVFRQLVEQLQQVITKQLSKHYRSMYEHWEDMRSEVIAKIWKNRKTLKKTKTKNLADHYYYRIRTHLSRANTKIKKIKEDYEFRSKISIGNIDNERAPGFVDNEMPDETDKRTEDVRLDDEAGKKTGESTLKKKLAVQHKKAWHFDKNTIRREERNPILDICKECQLQCKRHAGKGVLGFRCFAFLPLDESKKDMRGVKTERGKGLSAMKKKPTTHITPSQTHASVPWKKDKDDDKADEDNDNK